jgi:hypothetical protein
MTALNRNPQNTAYLQASKYMLVFDRIGPVTYFCQSVNLPGISLGEAPWSTPIANLKSPGTKLSWNPLNINFIVDEKLATVKQLKDWFLSIASPEGFGERNSLRNKQNAMATDKKLPNLGTGILTILSNLNNPTTRVEFINIWPTNMTDIQFDVKLSADQPPTVDATFNYDYYTITDISS